MNYKIESEYVEKIVDGVECIEEVTYKVYEDGTKEIACTFCSPKEQPIPEPTQLDLIQQAVEKSNEELRQEGAEAVTLELIERGVL